MDFFQFVEQFVYNYNPYKQKPTKLNLSRSQANLIDELDYNTAHIHFVCELPTHGRADGMGFKSQHFD